MLVEPIPIWIAWYQLAKKFVTAMYYWAKGGFKVVPHYVWWKRRLICKYCTNGVGHRCPTCGCFMTCIAHLSTSHCSNWDKFLDQPKDSIYAEPKEI